MGTIYIYIYRQKYIYLYVYKLKYIYGGSRGVYGGTRGVMGKYDKLKFICLFIHTHIFTNPSARAGYNTRSILKFNRFEFRVFLLLG